MCAAGARSERVACGGVVPSWRAACARGRPAPRTRARRYRPRALDRRQHGVSRPSVEDRRFDMNRRSSSSAWWWWPGWPVGGPRVARGRATWPPLRKIAATVRHGQVGGRARPRRRRLGKIAGSRWFGDLHERTWRWCSATGLRRSPAPRRFSAVGGRSPVQDGSAIFGSSRRCADGSLPGTIPRRASPALSDGTGENRCGQEPCRAHVADRASGWVRIASVFEQHGRTLPCTSIGFRRSNDQLERGGQPGSVGGAGCCGQAGGYACCG